MCGPCQQVATRGSQLLRAPQQHQTGTWQENRQKRETPTGMKQQNLSPCRKPICLILATGWVLGHWPLRILPRLISSVFAIMSAPTRRILSGIQPTGIPHLGNYLGALHQWVQLQHQPDTQLYYSLVDLHAITIPYSPEELNKHTLYVTHNYHICCFVTGAHF